MKPIDPEVDKHLTMFLTVDDKQEVGLCSHAEIEGFFKCLAVMFPGIKHSMKFRLEPHEAHFRLKEKL